MQFFLEYTHCFSILYWRRLNPLKSLYGRGTLYAVTHDEAIITFTLLAYLLQLVEELLQVDFSLKRVLPQGGFLQNLT